MDCDPRDGYDSRDDERFGPNGQRRGASDDDRDWDDWRQREIASRDRTDDARDLARGPGDSRQSHDGKTRDTIHVMMRAGPTASAATLRAMSLTRPSAARLERL
jgi:hypothetical protein